MTGFLILWVIVLVATLVQWTAEPDLTHELTAIILTYGVIVAWATYASFNVLGVKGTIITSVLLGMALNFSQVAFDWASTPDTAIKAFVFLVACCGTAVAVPFLKKDYSLE